MKPEEQPGLLLPPGTGLPWNKLFLRQIGANPPAKGQPRCVSTGQGTVYPILGQSFEVPASHQEIFAPLSSDRREKPDPWKHSGSPSLPLDCAGGRGTDGSTATGDTPRNTINLPEGKGFQQGAKEDREALGGEARR